LIGFLPYTLPCHPKSPLPHENRPRDAATNYDMSHRKYTPSPCMYSTIVKFRASAPGTTYSTTLPRLYDHFAPSRPRVVFLFTIFMIKWAAHDDVADVPLCGLLSLCPFLPLRHFPLTHVTIRHPEALGNGFFSISLLPRTSTGFSRSNTVSVYTHIFPSSSHVRHIFLSLLGLSFYNHTLRYAPPSRFLSTSS